MKNIYKASADQLQPGCQIHRSSPYPKQHIMDGRAAIFLALIIIVAFVLRVYRLGVDSLWLDESFSVVLSQNDLSGMIHLANEDIHPPLYYLILHLFVGLPGKIEIMARMPSVIFGTLTILPLYFLTKDLFSRNTALVAALIYAVSFPSITYSQEARMYALMMFLGALQMYYFYRSLKDDRPSDWAIFTISSVLMAYTHYYGIVLIGALALFGLAVSFKRASHNKRTFLSLALSLALIFMAFLPQIPVMYHQSQSDMANTEVNPDNIMFYPRLAFFMTACGVENPTTLFSIALTALFMTVAIGGIIVDLKGRMSALSYLITILVISSLACLILSNILRFCGYRYIIFLLVPYLMLVASGIVSTAGAFSTRYKKIPGLLPMLVILSLVLVIEAFMIAPLYGGSNVDLRSAIEYVKGHSNAGDSMVIFNSDNISSEYYAGLMGVQDMVIKNLSYEELKKPNNDVRWVIISDDRDRPANANIRPWLDEHMQLRASMARVSVYGGA